MKTFDEIFILDLHGNSRKKERASDGSEDQNVFDIQQGVAIAFFIKNSDAITSTVKHEDLWGRRQTKYDWLEGNMILSTEWKQLSPSSPKYFFVPVDEEKLRRYNDWTRISEIFPTSSVGIVTARDKLTIHFTPNEVWNTVNLFIKLSPENARTAFELGKDTHLIGRWNMPEEFSRVRGQTNRRWYPFCTDHLMFVSHTIQVDLEFPYLQTEIGVIANMLGRILQLLHAGSIGR